MTSITFIIQYYYCWYWGLEGTEAERESGKKKKVENSSEKKKKLRNCAMILLDSGLN